MSLSSHQRIKLCYIVYCRYPDIAVCEEEYIVEVASRGHDVTVVSFRDSGQHEVELLKGIKVVRFPLPGRSFEKKSMFHFLRKVGQFLRAKRFGIVHIFNSCPHFALVRIFGSQRSKYVYHSLSHPLDSSRSRILWRKLVIFVYCLFVHKVVIISEELKEHMPGIKNLSKTVIIRLGFDGKSFGSISDGEKTALRQQMKIPEGSPVLVFCGVISKVRELDRLMLVFRKVVAPYPDVICLVIGDGDVLHEMKEFVCSLGIDKNVIFTGWVKHNDLPSYYGIADIGISYIPLKEMYDYNPPKKTYEYLACGLPVIATQTVSNTRIITDGMNGLLVSDNIEEVAAALHCLLNDKDLQGFLSRNARPSVIQFDLRKIVSNSLLPLYESLLN